MRKSVGETADELMTLLPIVERELRVASRRRATYRMRVTAALVAIVMFAWMMLAFLQGVPSTQHGRYLFRTLFGLAFVYCLFIGARLTADCLSEEKRDGTLGLLFLTDLKGYDVVLGKLAATSINSVYALLAIVPVMSLPVQLGGVTATELWQAALVLLNTLFFSLSTGVLVSTLSRDERKAMFSTIFFVLLVAFAPFVLAFVLSMYFPHWFNRPETIWPIVMLSPVSVFGSIVITGAPGLPFAMMPAGSFWMSVTCVHLLSWLMLLVASLILPRVWQARLSNSKLDRHRERVEQWVYGRAEGRRSHRTRLLNINPFLWLVSRERGKPFYVWLYVVAVSGTWLWGWFRYSDLMFDRKTLVPTVLLFQSFLKLWIVSEACTRLAEDRRIGALELLLSTPMTTREILRGQWLALQRQFALPLGAILVAEFVLLRQQFTTQLVLLNVLMLAADVLTLGWVGMWLGLTARNLNRAILGTVGRVLVLPWGGFFTTMFALGLFWRGPFEPGEAFRLYVWFGIGLATNCVFGVWWARRHLLQDFREAATQRYQAEKIDWFRRRSRGEDVAPIPGAAAHREA
jgi:ABC-type Na+ efflux pump permease subunit